MILLGLDDGVHSLRLVEHNDPHRLAIGFVRFHPHLLQYKVIFFKATGMYNQCCGAATTIFREPSKAFIPFCEVTFF